MEPEYIPCEFPDPWCPGAVYCEASLRPSCRRLADATYSNQIEYLLCERTLSTEEISRQTLQSPLGDVATAVTECQDLVGQLKEDADQLLRQVKATLSQPKTPDPGYAGLDERRFRRGLGAIGMAIARLVPTLARSGSATINTANAVRGSAAIARTTSQGARTAVRASTQSLGAIPKTGTRSLSLSPGQRAPKQPDPCHGLHPLDG